MEDRNPAPARSLAERPGAGWPICAYTDEVCLMYEIGSAVGVDLLSSFLGFVRGAEAGARLTLQRNQGGFTLQVMGAVERAAAAPLSPGDLCALTGRFGDPASGGSSGRESG